MPYDETERCPICKRQASVCRTFKMTLTRKYTEAERKKILRDFHPSELEAAKLRAEEEHKKELNIRRGTRG